MTQESWLSDTSAHHIPAEPARPSLNPQGNEVMTERIAGEIMKHGIDVRLRSMVSDDEDLGRIDGAAIEVSTDPVEPTIAAFTLCHLFGHLVQFTTWERYGHLISAVSKAPPILLSDSFWDDFYLYELEAFGYGGTVLESAVPANIALRSQYANFLEVDFRHFRSFITTGKRQNRVAYREGVRNRYDCFPAVPCIKPLSIANVNWSLLKPINASIY